MTKGRTALSLKLVVPPTIPTDVVHFSLNLPQEVEVLGMTKGRVALPFGVTVVMTASRASFIPFPTCRRQVGLPLVGMTIHLCYLHSLSIKRTASLGFAPI